MMGTVVSESQEIDLNGFCELGLTEKYTMGILALIFKTLVPDWQITLDFKAASANIKARLHLGFEESPPLRVNKPGTGNRNRQSASLLHLASISGRSMS
jgi:hypothetical protein